MLKREIKREYDDMKGEREGEKERGGRERQGKKEERERKRVRDIYRV